MTKVCLIVGQAHEKHVIIRRQIKTFVAAGIELAVVDQDTTQTKDIDYQCMRHAEIKWQFLAKPIWMVLRRLPSPALHDLFWHCILWLRMATNACYMAVMAVSTNPDYYLAEDLQSVWAAILASKVRPRPILYNALELQSEQGDPAQFHQRVMRSLEQRFIPQVDYLIVPNHSRARIYVERYGVRREPIIIHNYPPIIDVQKTRKIHQVLSLSNNVHVVLYHGSLIPFRALDKLVESAAYFDENIVLVIIGEQGTYYRDVLYPLCKTRQLQNRVFFIPHIPPDEIHEYVASADLGIVIYDNVNLNNYLCAPTKLYEFMAMEVPVAACNFPEMAAFLQENPVGVMFDPASATSIAEAVNFHFKQTKDALVTIQKTLAASHYQFVWEKEGLKWLNILSSAHVYPSSKKLLSEDVNG